MNLFTKQNWSQKTDIENKVRGREEGWARADRSLDRVALAMAGACGADPRYVCCCFSEGTPHSNEIHPV